MVIDQFLFGAEGNAHARLLDHAEIIIAVANRDGVFHFDVVFLQDTDQGIGFAKGMPADAVWIIV